LAGLSLALAAAVKLTPGFLLLYWIGKRDWRSAFAFCLFSIALVAITIAWSGVSLFEDYLATLHRVSNTLLVAYNNQSLAAALGRLSSRHANILDWRILPLPLWLKLPGIAATVASCLGCGYLDRHERIRPLGAGAALVAATIFPALAWSHYFVVLIVPVMILTQRLYANALGMLLIGVIVALNFRPLALDQVHARGSAGWHDSFFVAALGILCLAAWQGWLSFRETGRLAQISALNGRPIGLKQGGRPQSSA
jgi:hypothetical protein